MTAQEAFEKWWANAPQLLTGHELAAYAFGAGWGARDTVAGLAQLAEQAVCSGQVVCSSRTPGSITDSGTWTKETTWTEPVPLAVVAEDIYKAYPRHVGKADAIKAIIRQVKRAQPASASYLLDRAKAYAAAVAQWPEDEKKYIPHPATWFNRGSYDDDPREWVKGNAAQTSRFSVHH